MSHIIAFCRRQTASETVPSSMGILRFCGLSRTYPWWPQGNSLVKNVMMVTFMCE
jgi:hypothetical protein